MLKMLFSTSFLITLGTVLTLAQTRGTQPGAGTKANESPDVTALKKEVATLHSEIEELKERASRLEFELADKADDQSFTILATDKRGFGRVDSTAGSFLVAVADTTPYLDGFKVKFRIGNINSAAYENTKLKLTWFSRTKSFPRKQKEESLTECLSAGTWNPIEVILPNTKAEELGRIKVQLETVTVSFACP
jgi:hypothetical protein